MFLCLYTIIDTFMQTRDKGVVHIVIIIRFLFVLVGINILRLKVAVVVYKQETLESKC